MIDLTSILKDYIKKMKRERREYNVQDILDFLRNGLFKKDFEQFLMESLLAFYTNNYRGKHKFQTWLSERIEERKLHDFGIVYKQEKEYDEWLLESVVFCLDNAKQLAEIEYAVEEIVILKNVAESSIHS